MCQNFQVTIVFGFFDLFCDLFLNGGLVLIIMVVQITKQEPLV